MIHFTSDTHYYHSNILKWHPDTRDNHTIVEDMNEALIDGWNSMVSADDTVYHLGDFAITSQARQACILRRLNGNIVMVLGNHDRALSGRFGLHMVEEGTVHAIHKGSHQEMLDGTLYVMNHYAQRVWNRSHYGAIHLYGHSHGSLPGLGKSVDVGIDSKEMTEFVGAIMRPYSLEEVTEFMNTKEVYTPDHHTSETN